MRRSILAAALWAGLLASPAAAQEPATMGVWAGQLMTLDFDAADKAGVHLWLDLHERQFPSGFLAIVRPGVGWKSGVGISGWIGYGWIPSWNGTELTHEHRIWEQVIGSGGTDVVRGMGRVRVEQRFVQGEPKVGHRIRLFGRLGVAALPTFGFSLWDEAFIHLNNTSYSTTGFNQNRAFLGPYFKAAAGWRVEVGYLNLVLQGADDLAMRHVIAMNLFIPFQVPDHRKKGKSASMRRGGLSDREALGVAEQASDLALGL